VQGGLAARRTEVAALEKKHAAVKAAHDAAAAALTNAEDLLQSLLTGLGGSRTDGNAAGGGYLAQLAGARAREEAARAEQTQAANRLASAKQELAAAEKRAAALARDAADGKKALEKMTREVEATEERRRKSGWSDEQETGMQRAREEAAKEARRLRDVRLLFALHHHC
jgi:structural maintenance of chromosome 2